MRAEIQHHINKYSYVLQPYLSLVLRLAFKVWCVLYKIFLLAKEIHGIYRTNAFEVS